MTVTPEENKAILEALAENDKTPKVYAAITRCTASLAKEGISKDRKNIQQGYAFRGIDDVYNAMAPVLAEHKLTILPNYTSREVTERIVKRSQGPDGVLFYVTVKGEFAFVSAEDGSSHTVVTYGEAMDSGDKATNKAMSAAYKYACMQAFAIPTEGDNDADATTHEIVPAPSYVAPSQKRKDYTVTGGYTADGQIDFDHAAAGVESLMLGAANISELQSIKKDNAKFLNAMQKERPDLFDYLKDLSGKTANALA